MSLTSCHLWKRNVSVCWSISLLIIILISQQCLLQCKVKAWRWPHNCDAQHHQKTHCVFFLSLTHCRHYSQMKWFGIRFQQFSVFFCGCLVTLFGFYYSFKRKCYVYFFNNVTGHSRLIVFKVFHSDSDKFITNFIKPLTLFYYHSFGMD